MRGYDAWLTREPDWRTEEPVLLHCRSCGAFLPRDPERTEEWGDGYDCDGTVRTVAQPYGEGLAAILGVDPEDTYNLAVSDCGIDTVPHVAHWVEVIGGVTEFRTCRACGTVNEEVTC